MSGLNLRLDQAATWLTRAQLVGDPATQVMRVHTDTRTLAAGDLFVAIKGERYDATQFLGEAKEKGAVAVMCNADAAQAVADVGLPALLVPDARAALGQLASGWRQKFELPLIAVTGSNGKTTVTQMIAAILKAWYGEAALATEGNFNNDIGLPLTLLRLRESSRVAVVELGMNHPGEIARLAEIARPSVALVNNAQREHQEFMASVEAVAQENGAVFGALLPEGVAVFPAGDVYEPLWTAASAGHQQLKFGDQIQGALVHAVQAQWLIDHWQIKANTPAGAIDFSLHLPGRHNVSNALAALACVTAAGAPTAAMEQGLSDFRPVKGRSRAILLRQRGRSVTLIDDTYNANPDSVRAIIDVLAELPGPRLLVLGDMGEVGEQGPAFHAEVGAYARQRGIERLLAHGPLAIHAAMGFGGGLHFEEFSALIEAVRTHLGSCASVAVKGSRFMRMERVVEAVSTSTEHATEGAHAA